MDNNIYQTLKLNKNAVEKRRILFKYSVVIFVLLAAVSWWLWPADTANSFQYQTAEVLSADLTISVTATGVLQPLNQVDVGTEVSGTVDEVLIDFNDHVQIGQILARLDTEQLSARLRQSQAALELARALVKENEATVLETDIALRRAKGLQHKQLGTQEQVDTAQAASTRAVASLQRAKAQVTQAEAQLDLDKAALSKAEIRSPINGIVLTRQIEPGQTVAATLQTPVLFTLAENLSQMELHVSVDEADVGMVAEGQRANFTVDAFARRSFPALISQVRFAPQTVEGVVTYETVLSVDNDDLALRPGMTATADIIVQQLKNVLLVPNAALRFKPPQKQTKEKSGLVSQLYSHRPPTSRKQAEQTGNRSQQESIWLLTASGPVQRQVTTGATDGRMTEIRAGELKAGETVIVDTIAAGA